MVLIKKHGVILEPTKLKFENKGVFNPACIKKGKYVHMFYRAWNKENRSTIGYCKLDGPLNVIERAKKPMLFPEADYEYNLEDPRIVCINGTYYLTYTAYDGRNVRIVYPTVEADDLIQETSDSFAGPGTTFTLSEIPIDILGK